MLKSIINFILSIFKYFSIFFTSLSQLFLKLIKSELELSISYLKFLFDSFTKEKKRKINNNNSSPSLSIYRINSTALISILNRVFGITLFFLYYFVLFFTFFELYFINSIFNFVIYINIFIIFIFFYLSHIFFCTFIIFLPKYYIIHKTYANLIINLTLHFIFFILFNFYLFLFNFYFIDFFLTFLIFIFYINLFFFKFYWRIKNFVKWIWYIFTLDNFIYEDPPFIFLSLNTFTSDLNIKLKYYFDGMYIHRDLWRFIHNPLIKKAYKYEAYQNSNYIVK